MFLRGAASGAADVAALLLLLCAYVLAESQIGAYTVLANSLTPPALLSATLALASSVGHVGGFLGTYVLGALHDLLPGPPCSAPSSRRLPDRWQWDELASGDAAPAATCASEYANGTVIVGTVGLALTCLSGTAMLWANPTLRPRATMAAGTHTDALLN